MNRNPGNSDQTELVAACKGGRTLAGLYFSKIQKSQFPILLKRIHFNRFEGKKLPTGAILVTRPKDWQTRINHFGNEYVVGDPGVPDKAPAVRLFEQWLLSSHDPPSGCVPTCICFAAMAGRLVLRTRLWS